MNRYLNRPDLDLLQCRIMETSIEILNLKYWKSILKFAAFCVNLFQFLFNLKNECTYQEFINRSRIYKPEI